MTTSIAIATPIPICIQSPPLTTSSSFATTRALITAPQQLRRIYYMPTLYSPK